MTATYAFEKGALVRRGEKMPTGEVLRLATRRRAALNLATALAREHQAFVHDSRASQPEVTCYSISHPEARPKYPCDIRVLADAVIDAAELERRLRAGLRVAVAAVIAARSGRPVAIDSAVIQLTE